MWLPGAGAGELSPPLDAWYRGWLSKLTGGNQAKPLVVFCHPDCWGSWNAARRAILYGYTDVQWYEEGIEGWQDAGHETQAVQPEPPPHSTPHRASLKHGSATVVRVSLFFSFDSGTPLYGSARA